MSQHRGHEPQAQKPNKEKGHVDLVKEMHGCKEEVLDAVNALFVGLRTTQDEMSERLQGLEWDVRIVCADVQAIQQNVQDVYQSVHDVSQNVQEISNAVNEEGNTNSAEDNDDHENNGDNTDHDQGWGDQASWEDWPVAHHSSADSGVSGPSSVKEHAKPGGEKVDFSTNSTSVEQQEDSGKSYQEEPPEIVDFEDPANFKAIENYHLDGFRDALVEFQELASKFSAMPPDTSGNISAEARDLFAKIVYKANAFRPAAAAIVAFSHSQAYTIVDTPEKVSEMVDALAALPTNEPNISVDFEGKNLGRDGDLYLVVIHDYMNHHTYIVDTHHLKFPAFDTTGIRTDHTLRAVLESEKIPKLFWDVRQDSDAIYHHFKVKLAGILDVQLFHMAEMSVCYRDIRRIRPGLFNTIKYTINMDRAERDRWLSVKQRGKALWDPNQDGSFDRFIDRKRRFEIIEYCTGDVEYLRPLYGKAISVLSKGWKDKVMKATSQSIEETWEEDFKSSGVEGPWQ